MDVLRLIQVRSFKMPHNIGIYVRVSTEEQAQVAEGSLESQQHRIKSFIEIKKHQDKQWGNIFETYIDDGYSAKNTNRPAYQRMMRDLRNGKINLILVTDLSRLSRSIADFCELVRELEKFKAKFLSIKEQFDTSTPAGEMMVFNMINLAQFERKQTSERISMNFHSRAMRGLVNGGNPILGYDRDPSNPGRLIINKSEAKMVKYIFTVYKEEGSLSTAASRLSKEEIKRKVCGKRKYRHIDDGRWTVQAVRTVLRNYAYAGIREVNSRYKNEKVEDLKAWQKYQLVPASWKPIIEKTEFDQVQKMLEVASESERMRFKLANRRVFLVSGITRCGHCGRALFGQAAHGRRNVHRYYGHKKSVGETISCPIKRFPADEIEQALIQHLDKVIMEAGYLNNVQANIEKSLGLKKSVAKSEKQELVKSIVKINKEIDSIFEMVSNFSGSSAGKDLIKVKLDTLAKKKIDLERDLKEAEQLEVSQMEASGAKDYIETNIMDLKRGWKKATPMLQKRLISKIFNELVFTDKGVQVSYCLPEVISCFGNDTNKKRTPGSAPGVPNLLLKKPSGFFTSHGSPVVIRGGDGGSRTRVREGSASGFYMFSR